METLLSRNWHPLEMLWLVVASIAALIACHCGNDCSVQSVLAAVLGVIFVVLCAKGKWYCFFFGIIHSLLYGLISWDETLYGEAILKIGYAIPMHICGLFLWYRTTSRRTFEVIHRNLDGWGKFTVVFLMTVLTFLLGDVLRLWGDELPYIDAFTTVASVHAAWLMVNRYAEQWSLFIIINVVSILMWLYRYADDGGSIGMVVMWIIWTINSIYGWFKWNKS